MNVLVVSPYPPVPDGIAAYAAQTVARLAEEGHRVTVVSPQPSAASAHVPLPGVRGVLALRRHLAGVDRLVVQFHPDVFFPFPAPPGSRAAVATALCALFAAAAEVEVVVHEVDYSWGSGASPAAVAVRAMWRRVDRVLVHSEVERDRLVEAFGVERDRVHVVAHGRDFAPRTSVPREEARRSLGVPVDARLFLAIGFVQPHKGFDRAVRAFAGLAERGCRLAVVGSVRVEEPAVLRHAAELERLAEATPGVDLRLGWVSDERFDRWLAAADVVVLPYRGIWSSGVLERARLFDVDVVVTDVGGLAAQAAQHPRTHVVPDDDDALRDALHRLAGPPVAPGSAEAAAGPAADTAAWDDGEHWTAEQVQAEVAARAARRRGGPAGPAGAGPARVERRAAGTASRALRQLPVATAPAAFSTRPVSLAVKRVVRVLTGWQVDELVAHMNALRAATVAAVDQLEAQQAELAALTELAERAAQPPPGGR